MGMANRVALKDMGSDFVNSWTKFVDGEKDPRNLMLLFSMDRIILLEFDVANHIEVRVNQMLRSEADQAGYVRRYFLLFPHHVQASS